MFCSFVIQEKENLSMHLLYYIIKTAMMMVDCFA